MANRAFRLETLVDFVDDALTCPFPITERHIDSMMAALAEAGVQRVNWAYYGDGHGGYCLPAGISGGIEDASIGFDQNQWKACARTYDFLDNPLKVAAEAAHRHGMELYAYFKPYETGIAMVLHEGSPQAREWGRLPHSGGFLTWLDPFVLKNPHLRIQRRTDDLASGKAAAAVRAIRLMKKDARPSRITKEHLQIWTSPNNYRYQLAKIDFQFIQAVQPSPCEVRDIDGKVVTREGDPVLVLTLSGLKLNDRFILVTTDFAEGHGDFENVGTKILAALDVNGYEIPGVFSTGTSIWFPEWEDFRQRGVAFDTGRGPQLMTLDAPSASGGKGYVAFTRGRNAYLPGALCETEPEVQDFWLSCIQEMLDAGVDGVEFRVENHSTHTDTPEDYGFNPAVMQRIKGRGDLLSESAKVRGQAYTDFLRRAKRLIASRGKRMRPTLNLDWFRPDRPGARRIAYPANIDFDWGTWVEDGLLDEATLRMFQKPFDGIFGSDPVASEMLDACGKRKIPVTVNRYVWCRENLLDEFKHVYDDGRFNGFVLYETWSYLHFKETGECFLIGSVDELCPYDSLEMRQRRAASSRYVQEVCRYWKGL